MAKKIATKKAKEVEESVVIVRPDADPVIEKGLIALYTLQSIDSAKDKIEIIRGELPEAVRDLEDEIEGLKTRISNFSNDIKEVENQIKTRTSEIADHQAHIKKYQTQQENVRNNREFESLNKEIEYQGLEIDLCERRNREGNAKIKDLQQHIDAAHILLENREKDLVAKREELTSIIAETEKDEQQLIEKSKEQEKNIEERYLSAYHRIREGARNGLAVVQIDRDSCGGCFSNIPPQRQMEIRMHKKIIVCENCGRILVDDDIANRATQELEK